MTDGEEIWLTNMLFSLFERQRIAWKRFLLDYRKISETRGFQGVDISNARQQRAVGSGESI